MNKWLKKYSKQIVIGVGILAITNGIYGIFTATKTWKFALNGFTIALWIGTLLFLSGLIERIFDWWNRE